MKKKTKIFSLLLVIITMVFSCNEKLPNSPYDKNEETQSENYFPMTVGSWWVYDIKRYKNQDLLEDYSYTDTIVVFGEETYYGKKAVVFQSKSNGHIKYYYYNDDRLYLYTRYSMTGIIDSLWNIHADFRNKLEYTILDTSVGGGSYYMNYKRSFQYYETKLFDINSLNVEAIGIIRKDYSMGFVTENMPIMSRTDTTFEYYSNGIGLVYSIRYYDDNYNSKRETKLIKYEIK